MQKIVALWLACLLLAPAGSFAQDSSPSNSGGISQIPARALSVNMLREATNREAARLAATVPTVSAQQQSAPQRSWASRHPVLLGAVVGAGIGSLARGRLLGLPYDTCIYDSETTGCGPASSAIGAGIGAGFGALVGLIVSLARR